MNGSSSTDYFSLFGLSTFTANQPHRHIEVSINQPPIASKQILNSPSEVILNRNLQDFDSIFIKWTPPLTPKSPTNQGVCNINIVLEFTLSDANSNIITLQNTYNKSLNFNELFQIYNVPLLISANLEAEIRNGLASNADYTNLDIQEELIQHFNQNKYSYTRFLLSSLESDQLTDIIESITFNLNGTSRNLTTYIHPSPIAISENYLLFSPRKLPREYRGDIIWQYIANLNTLLIEYKKSNSNRVKDTVYLPTAGVFAEAILGRSNASEFVDPRRFWNWQDSPIPFSAPQIAAISAGNHVVSDNSDSLTPNIPASNLNIINPPAYPLPNSLQSSLMAIQNGNMFRDMSNAGNLTSILSNLANLANNTASLAGNLSGQAAENALNSAIALGNQVAGMVNNASKMNLPSAPSNPTQKAGLLNTIEDLNKNNKQNSDYTPKEKAILASQGLDYNSLISYNDSDLNKEVNKIITFGYVEVKLRVFIPSEIVNMDVLDILDGYGGDNRNFSYSSGTHRAQMQCRLDLNPNFKEDPFTYSPLKEWGETKKYKLEDIEQVPGRPTWFYKKKNNSVEPIETGKLVSSSENIDVIGARVKGYKNFNNDAIVTGFFLAGSNPLIQMAPDISARIFISLIQIDDNTVIYEISGRHDGFPSYEIYLNSKLVYGYDPETYGNGPTSLFSLPYSGGDIEITPNFEILKLS